jgi:DNA-binding transcriptional LysR family regulator
VATKLNLVSAATILNLDSSTVSRKITQVEHELGAALFNRSTRSVTLTNFGIRFLKHAEFILKEYDLAIENAQYERNVLSGTLKVTSSVAFTEQILVPLLPKFLEQHPEISVQLLPTDRNVDLAKESVDIAIRLTQQVSGDYVITKLFPTNYSIFATPEYAEKVGKLDSPERLSQLDPIVYELPGFGSGNFGKSKFQKGNF